MFVGDRHGNLFWRNGARVNGGQIASEDSQQPLSKLGPGLGREFHRIASSLR